MFCALLTSRYQVSVYRTIGPLVLDTLDDMSRVVRKPAFCICENKDADPLS